MTRLLFRLSFSCLCGLMVLSGCYNDKAALLYPVNTCDTTTTATYNAVVKPIMMQSCAIGGCHNTTAAAGSVILDNYAGTMTTAKDGRLVGVITHAAGYSPMPKNNNKLDDCSIRKISQWVTAGALNN